MKGFPLLAILRGTKSVMEKDLEQAFLRAMNKVIGGRDTFMATLMQNIYRGLEKIEEEYTIEQLNARLEELQREIELMRERRQKLKDAKAERVLRVNRIMELEEYLATQESPLEKFDEDLFRRLIEKIKVQSMVEVVFVFKTGVEVREILG